MIKQKKIMKKEIFLIIFVSLSNSIFAQFNSIVKNSDNTAWLIFTNSSLYQILVTDAGSVKMAYFGGKTQDIQNIRKEWKDELPVRGGFANSTPMLEVIFADGVRDVELTFVDANITTINGYVTLIITQKDTFYPLDVIEYIRVLPEYDLIEKWIEVKNTGKGRDENIKIENAQSGSFFLPKDDYSLTHLSGTSLHEYQPNKTLLTQGLKTLQVKNFRSFGSSFFAVRPERETSEISGKVWFGSLIYSGNWRVDIEKTAQGNVQVVSGINFWDQEVIIKPGEVFTTPKMLVGYTEKGMEGVSNNLASYTREQILPQSHRNKVRPVLYNSWYSTFYDVNEEQQLAMAKIAKEIGVEMLVIDDGWFKGRVNSRVGIGDWTVDENKFPNGLNTMIDKINAIGLEFGIWIEPEAVNTNSDLYRNHPDWVFHYPNRTRYKDKHILNLAREDVYEYLYNSIYKLLKENNIKYIKWDMNMALANPGFPMADTDEQRSVRIKYVENLYRLIDSLRQEFPDVWFENCASGGGRTDLGMLSRMDFAWASDNTDPVNRVFIHYSYLNAFPANTMISWVTREDWYRQNHSLEFKFDVSMSGILGVGYDITKWTEEEKTVAKEKIAYYKEIRETVQFGDHYRLLSPYENNASILQYVNKDKSESIVFVYNLARYPNNAIPETRRSQEIQLRGLQENALYKIDEFEGTFTGEFLMKKGIVFPALDAYKSKIIRIKRQ